VADPYLRGGRIHAWLWQVTADQLTKAGPEFHRHRLLERNAWRELAKVRGAQFQGSQWKKTRQLWAVFANHAGRAGELLSPHSVVGNSIQKETAKLLFDVRKMEVKEPLTWQEIASRATVAGVAIAGLGLVVNAARKGRR
jgi:hypothetical protein